MFVWLIASLLDLLTTYLGFKNGLTEGNPVWRPVAEKLGDGGMLAVNAGISALIALAGWYFEAPDEMLVILGGCRLIVVLANVRMLVK